MKQKLQTGKMDRVLSENEAAELYKMQKKSAPHASKEDIVEFLMSRDGDPSPEFKIKVRANKGEYEKYVDLIASALSDDAYKEDFFALTGTIINVSEDHVHAWATDIAEEALKRTN